MQFFFVKDQRSLKDVKGWKGRASLRDRLRDQRSFNVDGEASIFHGAQTVHVDFEKFVIS
jgi:hypothetical protein